MSGKVKVRLLVPRTGYGNRGDVVHYPAEEAERHMKMGLVEPLIETGSIAPPEATEPLPPEQRTEPEQIPVKLRRRR